MRRTNVALIAATLLWLIGAAALAGPWVKLDNPIRTSDGKVFSYEFFDDRQTTGGGFAETDAIKGYVTTIHYG